MTKKLSKEEKYGLRSNARGFLFYSKVYYKAFKKLDDLSHNKVEFYPATYFLASHSIELVLKSVLRAKKYTLDQLSGRKFGHNLEGLAEEIKKKKYIFLSKKEMAIIRFTNFWYKQKLYEYHTIGSKNLPDSGDLSFACSSLLSKAERIIK